jgi:hypothetical protein
MKTDSYLGLGINYINEFRETADNICALTAKYKLSTKGYHNPDLPLFSTLTSQRQFELVRLLKMYFESLLAIEAMGERLDNHDRATWCAISSMGLVPPADLFKHFSSDAAVEIYDINSLQIWRNFECLKLCSYTLEEIYCLEWFNRYKRDEKVSQACFEVVGGLVNSNTADIVFPDIAEHTIEETCSLDRLKLKMRFVLFSKLKNRDGKTVAFAAISDARVTGKVDQSQRMRPFLYAVPAQNCPESTI